MQKLLLQLTGLALMFSTVFMTGCETDPVDPVDPLGPVISFVDGAGFISADAIVDAGGIFYVKLNALKGDNPLNAMAIYEDGVKLSSDRLEIDGGAITNNNPFLITGAAKDGATYEIAITAVADFNTTKSYSFEVTDEKNLTDAVTVDILTQGVPVTEITDATLGILYNQAGPVGTGGLDLDTGNGTGSADGEAEIRDEGIDQAKPQSSDWRRQISGVNGSVIKVAGSSLPETFKYADVNYAEEIVSAYDLCDALTLQSADGTRMVTDVVAVGDIFIVKNGDKYYLLKVEEVNEVYIAPDTMGNNDDNYRFSIKF